ncbi:TPA: hypothetical protein N0X04_002835 [Klebsiella pneumoniae]|nr:hypothetical protein [Klebsiella pneumoniae]HCK7117687.1 hypothetical protein [Klebsiella pneumoniae]HCK7155541.1 hypothetical protein [Klebsiella pneumoniae]HCQ8149748.1 hypothetical protein [Klebsiella pneumoniae]
MNQAFICDAVRTPFGRFGGALATMRADDLAALPLKALLARNPGLDPSRIDDVIFGCANQAGEDNRNVARMALLLASETALSANDLQPLARVVGVATAGVAPRIMGFGPAPAVRKVLAQTGLTLGQMDVIELNEAFAAQALAVTRDLGLPDDAAHVNPNGGAIALGHPLGASGGRLAMTAAYQLKRTGGRYALCTMCIGVGQGIALIIERV